MNFWKQLLLVGTGGFLGTILRWVLTLRLQSSPWDILATNLIGSFAIGVVLGWPGDGLQERHRLFLATGLCGGFTTFSTFSHQTLEMLRVGDLNSAGLNIALSVSLCILGAWFGVALVQKLA